MENILSRSRDNIPEITDALFLFLDQRYKLLATKRKNLCRYPPTEAFFLSQMNCHVPGTEKTPGGSTG